MKKLLTTFLLLLSLSPLSPLTLAAQTAYAQDDAATTSPAETSLKESTFDVGKILNTDDQDQSYFAEKDIYGKKITQAPIVSLIITVINFALRIIGSIAVLILIGAGLMMMLSQGNQQRLDSAKEMLKYAIIGLLITFLSYIIVISIQSLFITSDQSLGNETNQGIPNSLEDNKNSIK